MTEHPYPGAASPNPPPSPAAPSAAPLNDAFARLRAVGIHRDTDRRWFGGVCAGIAARLRVDPILIRAGFIVLTFAGGLGVTAYLVLWLLIPDRTGTLLAERALRGEGWPVVLLVVTGLVLVGGAISVGDQGFWSGPVWLLATLALIGWLVIERRRSGGDPGSGVAPPEPAAAVASPPEPGDDTPTDDRPTGAATTSALAYRYPSAQEPVVAPPPLGSSADPAISAPSPTSGAAMTPQSSTSSGSPSAPTAAVVPPPADGAPSAPSGGHGYPPPPMRYGYGASPPGAMPPVPPRVAPAAPPPRPRRRRPSWFVGLMSLGLAITLVGLGVVLDGPLGFPGTPSVLGLVLALVGVSLVTLTLGSTGRASGFSGLLVVVLAGSLMVGVALSRLETDGVIEIDTSATPERVWQPTPADGAARFRTDIGTAMLDLSGFAGPGSAAAAAAAPTRGPIDAEVGAGRLIVVVPAGTTARITTDIGLGELIRDTGDGPVASRDQVSATTTTTVGDGRTPDVEVRAKVGLGEIVIKER